LSDHALVTVTLDISRPPVQYAWTTRRNWRNLSLSEFKTDLMASRLCNDLSSLGEMSADELTDLYGVVMRSLLDKHCPVRKVRHRLAETTPWFDSDCRASRRCSRQLERRYRRNRFRADKLAWADQLRQMRLLYEDKHRKYWRGKIADNKGDCQKLWRTLSGIMGEKSSRHVDSDAYSAEKVARFFDDKVTNVRATTLNTPLHDIPVTATHTLDVWSPVTANEVRKLILSACNKTCQSDPVPTWLVKQFGCHLSPFIARLFNASLTTGYFPAKFKHAIVLPLLKKDGLDKDQLMNYRPVANLPFLSKLLERVIQRQLQRFLSAHSMMPIHQPAHRRYRSTETVLLKVFDNLQ